ncbi:GSN [Mytilus edulis]|uniref:Actin-modulator n=1 Tax=Mytilus edulis TaxID=6550 RepID=A0A8S3SDH6_MYTED|nr:GSN [Mytilus edulis]
MITIRDVHTEMYGALERTGSLVKPKQYDWKDSNLALFGSDTEKQVKKESAEHEPAWKKAGLKPGIQIWRIVKFKVTHWQEEDFGKFYDGDSYIILNTYKEEGNEQLLFDVHFWIGKYSTQDEYGTAAYKTVELDTYLDDAPIQHREVQGHESELFRSYFKTITYLHGGADSGFRHVKPEEYQPRLFHFHGDKYGVEVKEVTRKRSNLDSTDVYILDMGAKIYLWLGKGCNKDEKFKGLQYVNSLKDERRGKKTETETLEEETTSESDEFYKALDQGDEDDFDSSSDFVSSKTEKELYRLSDQTGEMKMTLEKTGQVQQGDLKSEDVFILDIQDELFVWIGSATTYAERKNAMTYAHNYLMKTDHPLVPVSCLNEGKTTKAFHSAIAA